MSNRLPILADEIALEHRAAAVAAENFVMHAIEAGARLIEAKQIVGHGGWQEWLERHVPDVSVRTAQRYMRATKRAGESDTLSFSTLREIVGGGRNPSRIAGQAADIMTEWLTLDDRDKRWFRDLIEIVSTGPIPDQYLNADPVVIRRTAAGLRSLRQVLP